MENQAWNLAIQKFKLLPVSFDSVIKAKLETDPTSVKIFNKDKGTLWIVELKIDGYEVQLEVGKKTDGSVRARYLMFDGANGCVIRDLPSL